MTRGKKAIAAFIAELIFVGLLVLIFVRLGGLPDDTLSQTPGIGLIPRLPDTAFYLLVAALIALLASGLILTVVALLRERRGAGREKEPDAFPAAIVIAFVIISVAMTVLIGGTILALLVEPPARPGSEQGLVEKPGRIEEEPPSPEQPEPLGASGGVPGSGASAAGRYMLVASMFVALGLAIVLVVRLARARLAPEAEGESSLERLRADLKEAAEQSIEAVLREEDPRKAVVACYARMEQVLHAHGYPRAPHMTPIEYMTATLNAVAAAGTAAGAARAEAVSPLLRLTELYEVARFSAHTIFPKDKAAAISCLEQIGGSL